MKTYRVNITVEIDEDGNWNVEKFLEELGKCKFSGSFNVFGDFLGLDHTGYIY